jgi:hypothetical protein
MPTLINTFGFTGILQKKQSELSSQVPEVVTLQILSSGTNRTTINNSPVTFEGENQYPPLGKPFLVSGGGSRIGAPESLRTVDIRGSYNIRTLYVNLIDEFNITVVDTKNYVIGGSGITVVVAPFWS